MTDAPTAPAAVATSQAPGQAPRTFGQALYENIVGYPEGDPRAVVDTPGERLGELIRGGTAAVARGMADVPALPANLAQLASAGADYILNKAGIIQGPSALSRGLEALPDTREMLASVPIIGPESQYVAPGEAGQYISTAGEFAGGAGLLGKASSLAQTGGQMMRYGVAPGVASEAAGQLTEGTYLEPYARAGAAIVAPSVAGRLVSPFGGADPELISAAQRARNIGLRPSAGQTVRSPRLQSLEDTLSPTPEQLDTLNRAAMQTVGSTATRATPRALSEAQENLSAQYDDILNNVDFVPNQPLAQKAQEAVDNYLENAPATTVVPRVRNVANEIIEAATSPNPTPISLETFRRWRTALGNLVTSKDEATQQAARDLRRVIDDATDQALIAAGRAGDVERLRTVRRQWWNLLGLKDAASGAGSDTRLGRLSPEALRAAVRRTQGPDAISMGTGTDLAEIALLGETVIPSAPTVLRGGQRTMQPEDLAGAAGVVTGGLPGLLTGIAATAGARELVNSPLMQAYLRNQRVGPVSGRGILSTGAGIINDENSPLRITIAPE